MRALALPAAVVLSLCLYAPLPALEKKLYGMISRLCAAMQTVLENKQIKARHALPITLALLALVSALLSAVHPLVCAAVAAPLFTFSAVMPGCINAKEALDSGKYARDIPAYEAIVRENCLSLAPAFVRGLFAPLLLTAAGLPLYIGPALAYVYAALCAAGGGHAWAARALARINRAADKVFSAMLVLCAGLVGRNPLRIHARSAQERLIRTLGVAGDRTDTHAPMSGDIAQGLFVCCFAGGLLAFVLTLALIAVC